jgi:hypothetical protein
MADIANTLPLSRESVIKAHAIIQDRVHRTPVQTNKTLSGLASSVRDLQGTRWEGREPAKPKFKLWFKCENLQRIGAFKARGAFHAVKSLVKEPGFVEGGGMKKGVVTHSSGKKKDFQSSSGIFCLLCLLSVKCLFEMPYGISLRNERRPMETTHIGTVSDNGIPHTNLLYR